MSKPPVIVLQFLSIQRPKLMLRAVERLTVKEAIVILDLEDALWDVFFPQRTAEIKEKGRKDLVTFAQDYSEIFSERQIGIRLNTSSSPEFKHDLAALSQIANTVKFHTLILTKVESADDMETSIEKIDEKKILYKNIALIVETVSGLNNLTEILVAAKRHHVSYIVYGHYDYSLDAGHWPFLEYDENDFWENAIPIIHQIEEKGMHYIHPPFFQIYDNIQFTAIFQQLRNICTRTFGAITLGEEQTRLCLELAKDKAYRESRPLRRSEAYLQEERIQAAKRVKNSFEKNRRANASFALDPKTGRFISPHVYLAALRYLEKVQNDKASI